MKALQSHTRGTRLTALREQLASIEAQLDAMKLDPDAPDYGVAMTLACVVRGKHADAMAELEALEGLCE